MLGLIRKDNRKLKQIAYLGWLGAGNLGDDGCYQLFRQRVQAISKETTCIPITIYESEGALFARRIDAGKRPRKPWQPEAYDYVVLGGGSLLNADRYIQALACAQAAGVPTAIWGAGFDGLPHGLVPRLLRGHAPSGDDQGTVRQESSPDLSAPALNRPSLGAPAFNVPTLNDSGLNDSELNVPGLSNSAARVIRSCRIAGVRGPVTAAWLEANGCPPISVSGDPGLLLEPISPVAGAASTPSQIAVIWGMSHRATHESTSRKGTSHDALTRAVATWLKKIAHHYHLVICAMWSHDAPYAKQLATLVGEGAELREEPLTLDAFRALAGQSAAMLSYRLHGCIFSAACTTPFCSIAYRSKCYDFAHSIGAGAWVVEPGDRDFQDRLDHWLAHTVGDNRDSVRDQLTQSTLQHRKSLTEMLATILETITLEPKVGP